MSTSHKSFGKGGDSAQGTSGSSAGANNGRKPGRNVKGKKRQATSPANEDDVERHKRLRLNWLHALQEQEREFRERESEMREAAERTAALRARLAELDEGDPEFEREISLVHLILPVAALDVEWSPTPEWEPGDFEVPVLEATSEVGSQDVRDEGALQWLQPVNINLYFV